MSHPPPSKSRVNGRDRGFTLIELSIVLVIIGLIVGGVLVGRDLINAAAVRAQISQIEKYQTAVNTFRGKYGYLPGDIPAQPAAQFGFASRGSLAGQGDGNGIIEGFDTQRNRIYTLCGETGLFWRDLSQINLIDGTFTMATYSYDVGGCNIAGPSITQFIQYFPSAKIGSGGYVQVWSGGEHGDMQNYFSIAVVNRIDVSLEKSYPLITPQQAYSIDRKIDDGLPQAGSVLAMYPNNSVQDPAGDSISDLWAENWVAEGYGGDCEPNTCAPVTAGDGEATPGLNQGDNNTCYDNNNVPGGQEEYSLANPNAVNCALSFRFQ